MRCKVRVYNDLKTFLRFELTQQLFLCNKSAQQNVVILGIVHPLLEKIGIRLLIGTARPKTTIIRSVRLQAEYAWIARKVHIQEEIYSYIFVNTAFINMLRYASNIRQSSFQPPSYFEILNSGSSI